MSLLAMGGSVAIAAAEEGQDGHFISEVRGGILAHDTGPFGNSKEDGIAISGEVLFSTPAFLEWALEPRPHLGFSYAPDEFSTSHAYFGLTWEADFFDDFFGYFGFGGAVHDADVLGEFDPDTNELNPQKALGCRVLLRENFGVGYRITERVNVAVHVEHISNANLCDKNEGLDGTGVRLGWVF